LHGQKVFSLQLACYANCIRIQLDGFLELIRVAADIASRNRRVDLKFS
jgi:hypothetical protein